MLPDSIRQYVRAALGELPLTALIRGGTVLDVHTGTLIQVDVGIFNDRVVWVGKGERRLSPDAEVINASGKFVVPAFMDAHIHLESTLLTPPRLAEVLVPHGVTTVFADPHEVANVLGVEGVKALLSMAEGIPLRIFVQVPSRVPTAPGLETSGAYLGPEEVGNLLSSEFSASLGELNYQNLLTLKNEYLMKVASAINRRKVINGHLPNPPYDVLNAAAAGGIMDDHESLSADEALLKLRLGIAVMVREGTSERNLRDLVVGLIKADLKDWRKVMFCTDDKHVTDIISEGHIDFNVREAIRLGLDPVKAYQAATINIAQHFRVDDFLGAVSPLRKADILILDDFREVKISAVLYEGKVVYGEGNTKFVSGDITVPEIGLSSVRVKRPVRPEDLLIRIEGGEEALVRVMVVTPNQILVREGREWVKVSRDGYLLSDVGRDVLHIAVVERHFATGRVGKAFVKGFGLRRGAIASSVAHDHHNVVAVGADPLSMATAVEHLADIGGGFAATLGNDVIASLRLEFAGLMTSAPAEDVVEGLRRLNGSVREVLGCGLEAPFMQLEFITLPTVPELGLTDLGLIDSRRYEKVGPVVKVR
ncbi:MAG: adenine deaminase [Desulfurococcales archaeon]|nr:adenine deaminase [Desulfurococcales archaeon]